MIAEFDDEENPDNEEVLAEVNAILNDLVKEEVRRQIADDKIRPDGRKPDEIRPLDSEVGLLPRAHGSGLFTRGQTQALSVLTLGAMSEYQLIDGLGTDKKNALCITITSRISQLGKQVQCVHQDVVKLDMVH